MKKVVLDTNITLSAFFWKGHPRTIYVLAKEKKIVSLCSFNMENEFIRALSYPKFKLAPEEISPHVNDLRSVVQFISVKSKIDVIIDDPSDNIFVECAVDGKADYIITGDHHLLSLGNYKDIQIVTAKDFLIKEKFFNHET